MTDVTQVWTPIDFDVDGKHCDWLRVPYSTDLSGYGVVPVPIICIRNGGGPTALLLAGSHGDEYEGQIALAALARAIDHADIAGRIIILPALNAPAVDAGRRVSPLDAGNLNRLFPGDGSGGPTAMIAHYISSVLLPLADVAIDLHAGGRSCDYQPCALIRSGGTEAEHRQLIELATVFGAPITSISDGSGGGGRTTFSAAGQAQGVAVLTTELGGHAALLAEGVSIADQGVRRVLQHLGIAPGLNAEPAAPTRFMRVRGRGAFVYAMRKGLFEPAASVGEVVLAGQCAGHLHSIDRPWECPEPVAFSEGGLVACRRAPGADLAGRLSLQTAGRC